MNKLKSIAPMTKLWFVISLLVLLVWVIPTMVSYYKNQKSYHQKVELLDSLDHRAGAQLEAKPFHSEVFRLDAENYFDKVEVTSIENDAYRVLIYLDKSKIDTFHTFLKDLSLNYAVSLKDEILYEEKNSTLTVTMILKPLS
jgi:hypothetical protein